MNENKTISVNSKGFVVNFTDSNKHRFIPFVRQDLPRMMSAKYQEIEKPVFNKTQQRLYSEALYGTKLYTQEEIQKMPKSRVLQIIDICYKAQKFINRWKQEIVSEKVDNLLLSLFPKSSIVKAFADVKGYDDTLKVNYSFKDLGLDQIKIADKLISWSLLPKNFYELQ